MDRHHADASQFLDERGSALPLTPSGHNPQTIMEKAVRERIVESYFFKDQCFALNEADIVDRVVEHVSFVGGTYGSNQKPTPFLCLAFKLLQLAPGDDVLAEYLGHGGDKFKYLRALACFYVRLTRPGPQVYRTLEPFLEDRRKLRRKGRAGTSLTFVDQFVDDLLTKDRVCATTLWHMNKREAYEDSEQLEPRVSPLGDIEDLLDDDDDGDDDDDVEMANGGAPAANSDDEEGQIAEHESAREHHSSDDRGPRSEDRGMESDASRSSRKRPRSRSRDDGRDDGPE